MQYKCQDAFGPDAEVFIRHATQKQLSRMINSDYKNIIQGSGCFSAPALTGGPSTIYSNNK
jgi:hypothetical protein